MHCREPTCAFMNCGDTLKPHVSHGTNRGAACPGAGAAGGGGAIDGPLARGHGTSDALLARGSGMPESASLSSCTERTTLSRKRLNSNGLMGLPWSTPRWISMLPFITSPTNDAPISCPSTSSVALAPEYMPISVARNLPSMPLPISTSHSTE